MLQISVQNVSEELLLLRGFSFAVAVGSELSSLANRFRQAFQDFNCVFPVDASVCNTDALL